MEPPRIGHYREYPPPPGIDTAVRPKLTLDGHLINILDDSWSRLDKFFKDISSSVDQYMSQSTLDQCLAVVNGVLIEH